MNLGKAHLENRDSAKAIEEIQEALKIQPNSAPALRNLARGQLLARKFDEALEVLGRAAQLDADSPAGSYLLGLTCTHLNRAADAAAHFKKAAQLDPRTAAVRYQLAAAYQAGGQHDQARDQLLETVRLDPHHASAQFKLSTYARERGDMEEFRSRQQEFLRLRKVLGDETRTASALEQCIHTHPEAAPPRPLAVKASPSSGVEVRFQEMKEDAQPSAAGATVHTAVVIDVDDQGRPTLFTAEPEGFVSLRVYETERGWKRSHALKVLPEGFRPIMAAAGDFHNDVVKGERYDPAVHALNDVVLLSADSIALLKQVRRGEFVNVAETAGLAGRKARAARWVDFEHDGDIDLLLARESGLELWQNNGDARFQNVTEVVGISATGPTMDALSADLESDVAVDLIAARGDAPTAVFRNLRAGRFTAITAPPGPLPLAQRVLADDLDQDGAVDLAFVGEQEVVVQWSRPVAPLRIPLGGANPSTVFLFDFDNDGRLDLGGGASSGDRGVLRLWKNVADRWDASRTWPEVSEPTQLSAYTGPIPRQFIPADFDADGDTDLVIVTQDDRMRLLRNNGGHAAGQLKVRLATSKTNPSGIGVHLELRSGDFWVTRAVAQLPMEIGLAGHKKLDSVQTVWSNGVVDNQIDVSTESKVLTITEKNVAAGSCPFLYSWDGTRFRFVTDLLGNSPVGLLVTRDVALPADPDEIVWIGGTDHVKPRDGAFLLQATSEFREVFYLDQAVLLAADHPPDWELHSTDKLMPPPFPESRLVALASRRLLRGVECSDGLVRFGALREMDGDFAPPGAPLPPPMRGMCHKMALTLDFGPLADVRSPVLALTGWLQYGDASTNIALSQSRAHEVVPPVLEAEIADGWQPLDVVVGVPAGKTKTILCDLTGLMPLGTRRLRLTTTFEVRWDRIALFERQSLPTEWVRTLAVEGADLQWRGFSEISSRRPNHPTTPDHGVVFPNPPWRTTLQGWCTRYGDVRELITSIDGRLALLNSGDALTMSFPAAMLPPVPEGRARSFFFYSVGWDKDGDHNVLEGDRVEPLPRIETAPSPMGEPQVRNTLFEPQPAQADNSDDAVDADWEIKYNTRWVPAHRFAPGGPE